MTFAKSAKFSAVITIFLGLGVVGASVWYSIFHPGLFRDKNLHQNNKTNNITKYIPLDGSNVSGISDLEAAEMQENLKTIFRGCIFAGIFGATIQILLSLVITFSKDTNISSRLEAWEALTLVSLLIHVTSAIIPFTFDLETETFLGIKKFGHNLVSEWTWTGDDPDWLVFSKEEKGIADKTMLSYIWKNFTILAIALALNIFVSFIFLFVNGSWLCCCRNDERNTKVKRKRRTRTETENEEQEAEEVEMSEMTSGNGDDAGWGHGNFVTGSGNPVRMHLPGPDLICGSNQM